MIKYVSKCMILEKLISSRWKATSMLFFLLFFIERKKKKFLLFIFYRKKKKKKTLHIFLSSLLSFPTFPFSSLCAIFPLSFLFPLRYFARQKGDII